jgi:hypothetical protein
MNSQEANNTENSIFLIVKDFVTDLLGTFPELDENLHQGLRDIYNNNFETEDAKEIPTYIENLYPQHFFDILNKNDSLFNESIFLLPSIDFSVLMKENISENTKQILWKYLLLLGFSVFSKTENLDAFGENAKNMFETLDQNELKEKLNAAMQDMGDLFDTSSINMEDLPDVNQMQNHISGLLNSKLGKLAHEIAEETVESFDLENATTVDDVVKGLISNPAKLSSLVKNVSSKLDAKMKSGDLDEKELMQDANQILQNISSMPGLSNLNNLFKTMAKGNMPNPMKQQVAKTSMQEKLRKKLEKRQQEQQEQQEQQKNNNNSQEPLEKVWKPDDESEPMEKTLRSDKPKNKKRKKKKNNNKK